MKGGRREGGTEGGTEGETEGRLEGGNDVGREGGREATREERRSRRASPPPPFPSSGQKWVQVSTFRPGRRRTAGPRRGLVLVVEVEEDCYGREGRRRARRPCSPPAFEARSSSPFAPPPSSSPFPLF